jgi:transposase
MPNLCVEAKEAIVTEALSRGSRPLHEIARRYTISESSLYKWLKLAREGLPLGSKGGIDESGIPPLAHLLATVGLDEDGVSTYCREQGIHNFQLKAWRDDLMKQSSKSSFSVKESAEVRALRLENKRLKKELQRKDKALAETSALLILKKKADLIWGGIGED